MNEKSIIYVLLKLRNKLSPFNILMTYICISRYKLKEV